MGNLKFVIYSLLLPATFGSQGSRKITNYKFQITNPSASSSPLSFRGVGIGC